MKAMISCDEVFDVLTRGPFPTGQADDRDVDSHLSACHECRELAEALRPAVDLFHESMLDREEMGLPTYLGRIEDAARSGKPLPLVKIAANTSASRRSTWVHILAGGLLGLAASLVIWLGSLAAGSVANSGLGDPLGRRDSPTGQPDDSVPDHGRSMLVSLGLPLSCLPSRGEQRHPQLAQSSASLGTNGMTTQNEFVCCTRCHFSGGGVSLPSPRGRSTVMMACAACHKPSARSDLLGRIWRNTYPPAC